MQHVFVYAAIAAAVGLVIGCGQSGTVGPAPARAKHTDVTVADYTPTAAAAVLPRCECPRAPAPITVDGDLSEWEKVPAIVLDKAESARNESGKWAGPQDCSGSMRMCWDSEYLYLAFDVTDDVFNQPFTGSDIWGGDCVQFAFDPIEERTKGRYAPNEQEYTAALTSDGPLLYRTGQPVPVKSAKLAIVHKPGSGGAFYEIGIPWSEMAPLAPGLMSSFGFTFCINDSDAGKDLKSWLEWTPGICSGKDASRFGQAAFDFVPPAAGASEYYAAAHIPDQPDLESLKFRLFCFAPGEEKLQVKLSLSSDGKEVAGATRAVAVSPGASRRELTWKISGLADGSYKGTISIEPPTGAKVERSFRYERVMTAPIRAKAEAVKAKAARAAESRPALYRRNAASIAYRLQSMEAWMAAGHDVKVWRRVAELAQETEDIVDATARGTDWFASARGRLIRAYAAPEDNMVQPFLVSVPNDYDGSKPYPLVIWLHGYGGEELTWEGWFVKHDAGASGEVRPGYLIANPYGRGNAGWRGWARNDVFHVLEEMKKRYNIDENRVCITGFSMGGFGTWHLATRYPDLWAAASPQAGGAGLDTWKRFAGDPSTAADWRARLSVSGCEMFLLENFLDLPVIAWNGISDSAVRVENTESAFERLRKLEYEAALMLGVRQGHDVPEVLRRATRDWMLTFTRNPAPERVLYRTFDLRYNKAYWVEIDELVEDYRLSEVKALWRVPGRIEIESKNVSRMTLDLPEARRKDATSLSVLINGAEVTVSAIPKERVLHLASADGGKSWAASAAPYRAGTIKKHGLSGPMSEALGERFLIVYGTVGSDNATAVNRAEAEAFAKGLKGLTSGRMWGTFAAVADSAVGEPDARGANLVLFGGPESNACARKIAAALPVSVEGGKLTFRGKTYDAPGTAVKFIYPNPDAPGRYVLVSCGATPEAIRNIAQSGGEQPDWLVFDSARSERRGRGAARYADGGFFDRDWK